MTTKTKEQEEHQEQLAYERQAAMLRLENHILRTRATLARAMAKAKDAIEPYLAFVERGRVLKPADRLDLEQHIFELREATFAASVAISVEESRKAAGARLSPKAVMHLDKLSRGLAVATSLMNEITVERMVKEDDAGKIDPKMTTAERMSVGRRSGEKYLWVQWRSASVNLFRAFKYFFFITGDVPLKVIKLSRELSDAWVNEFIAPSEEDKVRAALVKLVEGLRGEFREAAQSEAAAKELRDFNWVSMDDKVKIARRIIDSTAHATAITKVSFVELVDHDGNLVGDYNPHVNVDRYVGAMAHRKARRVAVANPPEDVRVLGSWIKWMEYPA